MLLYSVDELHCGEGLSVTNSSAVAGQVSAS